MGFGNFLTFGKRTSQNKLNLEQEGWTRFAFSKGIIEPNFQFYDDDGSVDESRIHLDDISKGIFVTSFSLSLSFITTGDVVGYELEWLWGANDDKINVVKNLTGVESFSETHFANQFIERKFLSSVLTNVQVKRGTDGSGQDSQTLGVTGYYK